MSLDLWLRSTKCPICHHSEKTDSFNYTYNVSKMWYEIYPLDKGMVLIDGMTGNESFLKLNYALSCLAGESDKFISMNPTNDWGSYDGFIEYLIALIELSKKHPEWIWESCR